tara:strand:+ start:3805 stop:5763 length:1959 start_codon:yes stop_codon:yes gene_type:complete
MIVIVNGTEVDVVKKDLRTTIQNHNLGDLKTRNIPNASVKFLRTSKNAPVFEYLGEQGNTSVIPYRLTDIVIKEGDDIILKGKLKITKVTALYYEGIAKGEEGDIFDLIKDKDLKDLDFSSLNHYSSVSNYKNNLTNTTGFVYATANNGGGLDLPLNVNRQVPSLFKHYIWEKIWSEAGKSYNGSFFNDAGYKSEVISMSKGQIDTGVTFETASSGETDTFSFMPTLAYSLFTRSLESVATHDDFTDDRVTLNNNGGIVIKEKCKLKLRTQFFSAAYFSEDYQVGQSLISSFSMKQNGVSVYSYTISNVNEVATPSGSVYPYEVVNDLGLIEVFIFAEAGDVITFETSSVVNVFASTSNYTGGGSVPSIDFLISNAFSNTSIDIISSYVDFNKLIGDISQTAFIKDIINQYGLMFNLNTLNPSNHVYEFDTMANVLSDKANAEDWSDKVSSDLITETSMGSYGVLNTFKYKYKEGLEHLLDYTHESTNLNQKGSNSLISSIYNVSARGVVGAFQSRRVLTIPLYKEEDNYLSPEQSNNVTSKLRFEYVEEFDIEDNDQGSDTVVGSTFHCYNDNVDFEYYANNYFSEFLDIIDSPVKVIVDVYLSPYDMTNLDFFKLKYMSQTGSYYYLNKVSNYEEGKPTKCELIKVAISS